MIEKCKAVLIDEIVKNSKDGQLTSKQHLLECEQVFLNKNADKTPDERDKLKIDLSDLCQEDGVKSIEGNKGLYFYASPWVSDNYAATKMRIDEEDYFTLIVKQVRYESKIYPRTTFIEQFLQSPYNIEKDTLNIIIESIEKDPDYEDIREISASNGDIYLYSTNSLEAAHAQYLAEWESVGSLECE